MNEIQGSNRPAAIHTIPTLTLWVTVLLILGFTTLALSLLIGLRTADSLSHPDPFAAYEGVWPGQSIESEADIDWRILDVSLTCLTWAAAGKFHLTFAVPEDNRTSGAARQEFASTGSPQDKVFDSISLSLENGQVDVPHLTSKTLQEDDLLLYWGVPDAIRQAGIVGHQALQWDRSSYRATALVQGTTSVVDDVTLLALEPLSFTTPTTTAPAP